MRFSTSTLGANYHFQPKSVVDPNHLGNVLTVVSDRKIAVASPQDWLDEFTNNDALNQAAAWNTVAAPLNTKSIDTDRIKFTSSNINVGLSKTFATPDATGTNYQISFDLDKGSCTQIKIVVFTAYGQSTPVYSNIVSASGTYVIPFTSQSVIAWIEVKKMADNGVAQSFYLDNIKLNNLSNPSQQVAYFTPDIISSTDYYAFGGKLPGRSFNSNSMRYQFNGKEFDPETGTQDYGFRIYSPALGKFLSVDPLSKEFPFYSPYHFAGNKPISHLDLDGQEDIYYNHPSVAKSRGYQAAITLLTSTDAYNGFLKNLKGANAVDVVIAPLNFNDTQIEASGFHTGGIGGQTVFIGKGEGITTPFSDAERRGVNLSRSNKQGRDVIVVYVNKGLIDFADAAISKLDIVPFGPQQKDNPTPMLSNFKIAQNSIEEIANIIGHELLTHTEDDLDKVDNVSTGQEHKDFYNDKDFYKKNNELYSPSYKDIKSNSEAGSLKNETKSKSAKVVNDVIKK